MGGSQTEVVVLETTTLPSNQRHTLTVFPRTRLLSIIGGCFSTNKSFPLPATRSGLRRVAAKCLENPGDEVLIVGHTDTSGTPDVNDPLSLERAKSIKALLEKDLDTWLGFYEDAALDGGVWGSEEDTLMLGSLVDFPQRPREQGVLEWFRQTRSLDGEGAIDEATRRKLIEEYFAEATATLEEGDIENSITAHGCGESFPVDDSGKTLDQDAADGQSEAEDRRVEFFFFAKGRGIQPPPPGDTSADDGPYLEWRKLSDEDERVLLKPSGDVFRVRLTLRGEVMPNEPFEVYDEGALLFQGNSTAEGDLSVALFAHTTQVDLVLPERKLTRTFDLIPSQEFPPATDLRGVRLRLFHLGFLSQVPQEPEQDEVTSHAITRFKERHQLPADAVRDDAFVTKLVEDYGS